MSKRTGWCCSFAISTVRFAFPQLCLKSLLRLCKAAKKHRKRKRFIEDLWCVCASLWHPGRCARNPVEPQITLLQRLSLIHVQSSEVPRYSFFLKGSSLWHRPKTAGFLNVLVHPARPERAT